MKTVTTGELKEHAEKNDATIINVLPQEQFEEEHIPGSINVPITVDDFPRQVEQRTGGKDATVILYCASATCPASEQAVEMLEKNGFKNAMDYAPGTQGWRESGFDLEVAHN